MNLFEHINVAQRFSGGSKILATESLAEKGPDKTAIALTVAKHLSEAKQPEAKLVQLVGMPVSN